ncbi:MAG: patatin-like phospholipase family protein, partial [Deltaproteobacteria bacterium]|nr:patatin-like phospholipase family protein [Deltaproteobacteria bacterium]
MDDAKPTFAMVLSGGGAKGAYEAGVIHYIRTVLAKDIGKQPHFSIYSGSSVGAINSAQLASTAQDPFLQGVRLREIWRKLDSDQIYFTDRRALSGLLAKAGFTMAATFFGLRRIG